jgi:ABC-type transporter Mla MlaB component
MTKDSTAGSRLVFDGALTMRTVETVRTTLREAIEQLPGEPSSIISIDCSAATEIDLTFVQLLIATRISAQRLNRTIVFDPRPDGVLLDTLTRGGFEVMPERVINATPAYWFQGALV